MPQVGLINQGNMYLTDDALMFVDGNAVFTDSSLVTLNGKMFLTGNFVNNVTKGKVFYTLSDGSFEFVGDKLQKIEGVASRDSNYIAFPNVVLNKDTNYVVMMLDMGADIKTLTLEKGKLSLLSDFSSIESDAMFHNAFYPYTIGHLRVDNVIYNHDSTAQGVVEIEMGLSPLSASANNKIIGFSSPYKSMYSDYFFGNYLASPTEKGLWGNDTASIKNPQTKLFAGQGYLVGQTILPQYGIRYAYDTQWGNPSELENVVAKDKIVLNRYKLEEDAIALKNIVNQADKYTIEELNTSDVIVSLKKGWQFIGNPFTSPLDLSLLLQQINNQSDPWKISRSFANDQGISPRYLVPSGGTGALDNWTPDRFTLNPMWLVGQAIGSTVSREADDKFILAPMQMIAVYSNEDVNISIPATERIHGSSKKNYPISEELLLELQTEYSFDRLAVVFRTGADIKAIDSYDVIKTVDSLASPGQIFTISEDGYGLITNILPPSATFVEMGLIPMLDTGTLTLKPYRLNSLLSATQIWLQDRIENAWVDIKAGETYSFTSKPGDRIDRFVLHFNVNKNSQSIPDKQLSDNIFSYKYAPNGLLGIHSASKIAAGSTGPVGSIETDKITDINSAKFCENSEAKINIFPAILSVQYQLYDTIYNGNLKKQELGTGSLFPSPEGLTFLTGEVFDRNEPSTWYAIAESKGIAPAIRRFLPLNFDSIILKKIYPDLRVSTCLGLQSINLNKYIDIENFEKITWSKVSGNGTLSDNILNANNDSKSTLSFTYKVTNECEEGNTAKLYLTQADKRVKAAPDTVVFCMQTTNLIQLNAIFGLDVSNGEILGVTPGLDSYIQKAQTPLVYEGTIMFDAKKAFSVSGLLSDAPPEYGTGAKQVNFKYKTSPESCYEEKEFDLILILTK